MDNNILSYSYIFCKKNLFYSLLVPIKNSSDQYLLSILFILSLSLWYMILYKNVTIMKVSNYFYLGAIPGTLGFGYMSDHYGRKGLKT